MKYSWYMPIVPTKEPEDDFPGWLFVVLFLLIGVAGAVLRLYTWPQGKPVSASFWMGLLLMPFLVWIALSAVFLHLQESARSHVNYWNRQHGLFAEYWQYWANMHWIIADCTVLTPEPDLAERLLGLESNPPFNPDKTLPLPAADNGGGGDRLESMLTRLLLPLVPAIRRVHPIVAPTIYLATGSKEDDQVVRRVWQSLALPGHAGILCPEAKNESLLTADIGEADKCYVVLACQLWRSEQEAPEYSELGAGLILISPNVADRLQLKQRTRLLRQIDAEPEEAGEALVMMLRAKQTVAGELRHTWFSHLDKASRHAVKAALQEFALSTTLHDVDQAIGKSGFANGWLLQAMAAQMVKHGQGTQLIANADKKKLTWNVVTSKLQPETIASDQESGFDPPGFAVLAYIAICAFFSCALTLEGNMDWEVFFWMAGGVIGLLVIGLVSAVCDMQRIDEEFWGRVSGQG